MSDSTSSFRFTAAPTMAGVDPADVTNAQSDTPLPYLVGEGMGALHWFSQIYSARAVAIATSTSKKTSSTGVKTWKYYGTIVGGFCLGPLARLTKVEVDNEVLWEGTLDRYSTTNPCTISISGRGTLDMYWGTEDQSISTTLYNTAYAAGHVHPAYRGLCFVVLRDFLFGTGVLQAPNIRLAGYRATSQSLITGDACALVDGQVNPYCVMAETLTNGLFGLGHPLSLFDAPSWQAAADSLISRAPEVYVSLYVSSQQTVRSLGEKLLAMCNGWIRAQRGTGSIEAGLFPPPADIVVSALAVINSQSLDSELEQTPQLWSNVKTRCIVSYSDRAELYKTLTQKYDDPRARVEVRKASTLSIELPIVRSEQALTQAQLIGRREALPSADYTAVVRAPTVSALLPGEHILLDIDPIPGGTQLQQPCRVSSISRPFTGGATIKLKSERTLAPIVYNPAVEPGTTTTDEVPAVLNSRLIELSPQASDGDEGAIALLAERPGSLVTDLYIRYDSISTTGSTYPVVSSTRGFALRASLNIGIASTDTSLVLDLPGTLDREIIESSPGAVAARNDDLLLVLIGTLDTSEDGYVLPVEILSVRDIVASATNQVTIAAFRARLGTAALAFSTAAEAWFIERASLPWFRHADFKLRITSGETCYFKLQPATSLQARDLGDVDAVSFRFDTVRAFAPYISATAPANDSGQSYVSCAIGDTLSFTGAVTDADSNLASLSLVQIVDGTEAVIYYRTYGSVATATYAAKVTYATTGVYQLVVRATDSTGRTTEYTHSIHCAISSTARSAEPTIEERGETVYYYAGSPYDASFNWYDEKTARIRCATMASEGGTSSTLRILTSTVPIGTALEAVDWYAGHPINSYADVGVGSNYGQVADSPVHEGSNARVWAKVVDTAGLLADSYPVYMDFANV